MGKDPSALVGSYVKEGQELCEVVDLSSLRVTATMDQAEASWLMGLGRDEYEVEMRLVSRVGTPLTGGTVRVVEAGQRELPHAALGFGGGGTIETRKEDKKGTVATIPRFKVYIEPKAAPDIPRGQPGERVALRFTLPSKPYLAQWIDRLQKMLQGRVNV